MRLRHAAAAALGALALTVAVPSSAHAASGDFTYVYRDLTGARQLGGFTDPPNQQCITLPEVANEWLTPPAHSPKNFTGATAVVFTGTDCQGDHFTLRPYGGHGSPGLEARSVFFL